MGHPTYFCKDLNELEDYNKKIDEEESKGNCCIVVENINFFMEEWGVELVQDEIINPKEEEKSLSVYNKKSFWSIEKCGIMVGINDNGGIWAWIKSKDFRYLSWKSIYYDK